MLYKHLSYDERAVIGVMKRRRHKNADIAKDMGRHRSTIGRELKRNFWDACRMEYSHSCAERKADARRAQGHRKKKTDNPVLQDYIFEKLKIGWSPETISGRLRIENIELFVSHETIYKFIYDEGEPYISLLPQRRPKRQKRGSPKKSRKILIPNRISINDRPKEIHKRKEFGHWESDSIVSGKSSAALNSMVERKSGFLQLSKLTSKTAKETCSAIIRKLSVFPSELRKSLTYDNGTENVLHSSVNEKLGTNSYFCNAYHSWEKGSVENINGLIRRFLPKNTDFAKISLDEIQHIENLLNHRPRKRHNFLTPYEIIIKSCVALQL